MNDIKFACPTCGQRIKCDSGHAGQHLPCPGCGADLEIPARGMREGESKGSPKKKGDRKEDVSCLCPVCRSELKVTMVDPSGLPTGNLPVAELVRPGSGSRFASAPASAAATEAEPAPVSSEHRVKAGEQTAGDEKRESQQPHPGGSARPRMSYVLTGKPPAPPARPDGTLRVRKENKGAVAAPEEESSNRPADSGA